MRAWTASASCPLLALYTLIAAMLQGSLVLLIIQRRDLSGLDQFVFLYLIAHFTVDVVRLLAGLVIVVRRGAPRSPSSAGRTGPP